MTQDKGKTQAAAKAPAKKKALSEFEQAALDYHRCPQPGKLEIQATKPLGNQRDLALAYSPGVATPCLAIEADPALAADYTGRANLVAVISNGTAVLGLGNIGPLAGKPVMEGKAVLFKKFAGVDVFDIEMNAPDVDTAVNTVAALEPTFGGINLEDIKAPECFEIEARLREKMKIPVFHDDQHGTAIIVAAAVLNGLELAGKKLSEVKIVASGAGAAAIACLNLLQRLGAQKKNIWVNDAEGLVYKGRTLRMDRWKEAYAQDTEARALADVIGGADVFLGLSVGNILKPELLKKMAAKPMIMALANPYPEIMPDEAKKARPDAMICTGRSDFPNQVNNVLCFPYIFRGALDVGATAINEEMKMAAVQAIAGLAKEEPTESEAQSAGGGRSAFGPEHLIPSPFDARLLMRIAPAVAKAAVDTGVAARPIDNWDAYRERLARFVFRTGLVMKPVFAAAKKVAQKRVAYADGEDERVLRAAQAAIEENIARPILVGRPNVVDVRLRRLGLRIKAGEDFDIINPEDDPRYRQYVDLLQKLGGRAGVTPRIAETLVRTSTVAIASLALVRGEADAMLCGLSGRFDTNLQMVEQVIGHAPAADKYASLSLLVSRAGPLFLADTYVRQDPSADELAQIAAWAVPELARFGIEAKVAFLSHSDFGSRESASALKMRQAAEKFHALCPDIESDGEMHGDSALSEILRNGVMPGSRLKGEANLLIFPNLDAANITLNVVKKQTDALHIGPILLGTKAPAHILTPSVTTRGILNMTALAVSEIAHKKAMHDRKA